MFLFDDLKSCINEKKVNVFGVIVNLLFYLLRFRTVERNFLSPASGEDREVRSELIASVDDAISMIEGRTSFLRRNRRETALEVLSGLKDFLDFRGSMNIIEKLSEFDEGADENDSEPE